MDDDQRPDKAPASAPLAPRAMMQSGSTSNAPSPPRDRDRRPTESARDRDDGPLSNQPSASSSRPGPQYLPPMGPSGRSSSQRDRGEPSRSDNADRDRDRDRRDGGGSSSRSGGLTSSTQAGDSGSLAERIGGVPPSLPARPDTGRHHGGRESRSDREIPRKRTFQGSCTTNLSRNVLTSLKIAQIQMTIHPMVHLSVLKSTVIPALAWARFRRSLDVTEEDLDVTKTNSLIPHV